MPYVAFILSWRTVSHLVLLISNSNLYLSRMLRYLKKIFLFFTFFLVFFVAKEFVELYSSIKSLHPMLGWVYLGTLGIAATYLIFLPVYHLLRIPVGPAPTLDKTEEDKIIKSRVKRFKNVHHNDGLLDITPQEDYRKEYALMVKNLGKESYKIRRKYVMKVFYGTGIVQNGFFDAFIILSSNISMVKELFLLYNGRVSYRDLLRIAKQVYYSLAIGGSEVVEYGVEELFSKLASRGIQSIPFLDKVTSSVADGYINALLTTRIALITENYCTKTYIKTEKELYPSASLLVKTTQSLTSGMVDNIISVLKNTVGSEKTTDFLLKAANPVGFVFEEAIDRTLPDKEDSSLKKNLKTGASFIGNPIIFGIDRWIKRSRDHRKLKEKL